MRAASTPLPAALPPDLASRVATILRAIATLVAHHFLRDPFRAALILPLCARLNRTVHRVQFHLARLAAGRTFSPRGPRQHPAAPRRAPTPSLLPRRRAWLVAAIGHEAAAYASQLQALLAEPEAAALLQTDPALARILRPIRHMLGLTTPRRKPPSRPRTVWKNPALPKPPRPWWMPPRRLRSG